MFTDRSKRCKTSKRKLLNYRQHYGPEIVMWPPLAERSTVTASDCPKRWIQMPPVSSDPLAVCGVGAPSYHLSLLIVRLILFFYVLRPKYLSPCDLHLNSLPQKIPPLSGLPLFFFFFFPLTTLDFLLMGHFTRPFSQTFPDSGLPVRLPLLITVCLYLFQGLIGNETGWWT